MADMAAIASIVSAGGTLVLAVATFGAVRSANTAARTAERSLMAGLRPLLIPSRTVDPPMKVLWRDSHFIALERPDVPANLLNALAGPDHLHVKTDAPDQRGSASDRRG